VRWLKNVSSLDSVRNKEGQSLDMFNVLICIIATPYSIASLSSSLLLLLYNCNSLFTCVQSDNVFVSTHMLSVHVFACFMHYPKCNTLAVRTRDVSPRLATITDITLSRNSCARRHLLSCNGHSAAIFCPVIGTRSQERR
jgi:hypothetical protein